MNRAGRRALIVLYANEANGKRLRAMETMRFGADGLVHEGEAMYGAALS